MEMGHQVWKMKVSEAIRLIFNHVTSFQMEKDETWESPTLYGGRGDVEETLSVLWTKIYERFDLYYFSLLSSLITITT